MTEETQGTNLSFSPGMLDRARNLHSKVSGNQWFIFWFVIGIYIFDLVLFRFKGINLVRVYRGEGLTGLYNIFYYGIIANAVFWTVLLLFYLYKKPENKEEFLSFTALLAAVFFVMTLSGLMNGLSWSNITALLHLYGMYLIRGNFLVDRLGKTSANYTTIFWIFIDFFFINLIHSFFPETEELVRLINYVVVPILPLYTLAKMEPTRWRNILVAIIGIFYIFLLLNTYNVNAQYLERFDQADINLGKESVVTVWDKIKNLGKNFYSTYNQSQAIIAGDYYTGQVEEYEHERLGVFLEDMEASDKEFLQNETITVWAILKAYTIEDKKINVTVTCSAKNGTNTVPGKVIPRDGKFNNIESYDEEFIKCIFSDEYKNKISRETKYYPITFNATFDFTTQSYLKTYYMEKERKRVLRSEGIDILNEYGITDRDPITKFTNGPIKIGMGTTTPLPVGVPTTNKDFSSFIGITIDNYWDGKVINISRLSLELPSGLSFDTKICNEFTGNASKYVLSKKELEQDNKKKFNLPKSYKCSLNLRNSRSLLGSTPISIKYFKANIDYTYQITEKTTVNVKKRS